MSGDDWLFHRCLKLIPEGLYQDPKSGNPLLFPLSDSPVNVGRSRTAAVKANMTEKPDWDVELALHYGNIWTVFLKHARGSR